MGLSAIAVGAMILTGVDRSGETLTDLTTRF
jgi:hypothetical protein